ncbi:hypothetical protein KKF84_21965 [Myxococcota bacterium]|nr:hypothetical protein [Myxococcota bacterium]
MRKNLARCKHALSNTLLLGLILSSMGGCSKGKDENQTREKIRKEVKREVATQLSSHKQKPPNSFAGGGQPSVKSPRDAMSGSNDSPEKIRRKISILELRLKKMQLGTGSSPQAIASLKQSLTKLRSRLAVLEAGGKPALGKLSKEEWDKKVADGIKKTGKTAYTMSRSLVMMIINGPNIDYSDAYVRPRMRRAANKGLHFSRIRAGGIFHALGLENGDLVTEVDKTPLDSMDKLMIIALALRTKPSVTVTILRNGKSLSSTITFTP